MSLVADGIRAVLAEREPGELVGVTCLARGADQIFARVVLDLSGTIEVVLPAADYSQRKVTPGNAAQFDDLIGKAAAVHTMPFEQSGGEAYLAASEHVLSGVDAAHALGLPVIVVWPDGAERD